MRMVLVMAFFLVGALLIGCVRTDETPQERHQRSLYLLGVGQQLLNQPRPVQCRTSNTTNPVTVCQ